MTVRRALLAAVVAAVVVAAVVIVILHNVSGHRQAELTKLKALVAAVPVPPGAVVVHEDAYAARGDAGAYVEREYRLPADHATKGIRAALERSRYQALGAQPGEVGDTVWSEDTTDDGGDLYVLPPHRSGGGIVLTWKGTRLDMSVEGGDVD